MRVTLYPRITEDMLMDEKNTVGADQENVNAPEEVVEETAAAEKAEDASKAEKKKGKKVDPKIAELEKALEAKESELAELQDKYMRMMAEYDNFRKRSAKEREGVYADAYADALTSILPIIDNLERAVGVTDADGMLKGLEMTLKGADEALKKMGVEAFGAEGDAFDPNIHNAVMMVDDENHNEGEIVSVFQKGYRKGDKIIRYAMVTVAN